MSGLRVFLGLSGAQVPRQSAKCETVKGDCLPGKRSAEKDKNKYYHNNFKTENLGNRENRYLIRLEAGKKKGGRDVQLLYLIFIQSIETGKGRLESGVGK